MLTGTPPPDDPPSALPQLASTVLVGEKVVAGVPWRYGDPATAFAFGRQLGAGSRSLVKLAVKRGGEGAGSSGAPPHTPLACKRLSKAHPRFSAVDARLEVEATSAAVSAAPGAVAVLHEVWEDGDAVYLFSDAALGGDLLDALVAGGRDEAGAPPTGAPAASPTAAAAAAAAGEALTPAPPPPSSSPIARRTAAPPPTAGAGAACPNRQPRPRARPSCSSSPACTPRAGSTGTSSPRTSCTGAGRTPGWRRWRACWAAACRPRGTRRHR